jgi:hypothetical protein
VPLTLSTLEFTRRWCLHILPKGYTKTRRFGGWSNRRCDEYLERCAILLEAVDAPLSAAALDFAPSLDLDNAELDNWGGEVDQATGPPCPRCGCELRLIADCDTPSWHDLLNSDSRPDWYGKDNLWPQQTLHAQLAAE